MNDEPWSAIAEVIDREQPGGEFDPLDLIFLQVYDKRVRQQEFEFVLLIDRIECGKQYPLTNTPIGSIRDFKMDSLRSYFSFSIENGEIAGAAYDLHPELGVTNSITIDCDDEDKLLYISWSAGFVLDEDWRPTADEFGFTDTVIFRDGRATLELP